MRNGGPYKGDSHSSSYERGKASPTRSKYLRASLGWEPLRECYLVAPGSGLSHYGALRRTKPALALTGHIPAARESPNSEIVAISSREEGKARGVTREHDIPKGYGSYEELLGDPVAVGHGDPQRLGGLG